MHWFRELPERVHPIPFDDTEPFLFTDLLDYADKDAEQSRVLFRPNYDQEIRLGNVLSAGIPVIQNELVPRDTVLIVSSQAHTFIKDLKTMNLVSENLVSENLVSENVVTQVEDTRPAPIAESIGLDEALKSLKRFALRIDSVSRQIATDAKTIQQEMNVFVSELTTAA